jgi:hypothetical protein
MPGHAATIAPGVVEGNGVWPVRRLILAESPLGPPRRQLSEPVPNSR